jgi:hypothetical protein
MSGDVDGELARKMHRTLEPYHGMIYFAPEAQSEYEQLGLPADEYFKGYFASRAAAMGEVTAEVVIATFYNFHPGLVRAAVPSCWDVAGPAEWGAARRRGADAALRRMLGDALATAEVDEAARLARQAADACTPAGRPLCAGLLSLDWPDEPHLALWHALSVLREHRGDGHISVLVHAEVSPIEALLLHETSGMLPRGFLQPSRAWSDDEWQTGADQLRERGWLTADGELSDEGRDVREGIERDTDRLALSPWHALGEPSCRRLRELVRPLSKTIVAAGGVAGGQPR